MGKSLEILKMVLFGLSLL